MEPSRARPLGEDRQGMGAVPLEAGLTAELVRWMGDVSNMVLYC